MKYEERKTVVGFPLGTYITKINRSRALIADRLEVTPKQLDNMVQRQRMPYACYLRLISAYGGAGFPAPRVERNRAAVLLAASYADDSPALPAAPVHLHPTPEPVPAAELSAPAPVASTRAMTAELTLAREIARQAVEILVEQLTTVTSQRDALIVERDRLNQRCQQLSEEVEVANEVLANQSARAQAITPLPVVETPQLVAAMELIRDVAPASAARALDTLEARLPKRERTG